MALDIGGGEVDASLVTWPLGLTIRERLYASTNHARALDKLREVVNTRYRDTQANESAESR